MVGFLFEYELLKSYPYTQRFGFSGLIPKRNEASLFYLLGIGVVYKSYTEGVKWFNVLFIISIIGSVLLGTKAILLFLIFLMGYHFRTNKKVIKSILYLMPVLVLLGIYILVYSNVIDYYTSQAEKYGWWYMILSGRNELFRVEVVNIISNWDIVNLVFGGQNQVEGMIEMDFVDLFLFMGVFGFSGYLYLYRQFFFKPLKGFGLFFTFVFLILAFFGGHFFCICR